MKKSFVAATGSWIGRAMAGLRKAPGSTRRRGSSQAGSLRMEALESRRVLAAAQLSALEVESLLNTASAVTPSTDAIIAVVDRSGQILGVRTEQSVPTADINYLTFAIDGAVAEARTGAFFSNGQAILTSRTVSHISQSTITQREVEANPNSSNPLINGPGYVAPVGIGGEFPPGILRQPLVDLFAIEHTNRTSIMVGGTTLTNRDSYGVQSGLLPGAISRGIATLPGGVGIYRAGTNELIGGLGVFFPGPTGSAAYEQGFVASATQTRTDRLNATKALEAETIALGTLLAPGSQLSVAPKIIVERAHIQPSMSPQAKVNAINAAARINLGGIALQSFGPQAGPLGVQTLFNLAKSLGKGSVNGSDQQVAPGPLGVKLLPGTAQAEGWLVAPSAGTALSAAQVTQIIQQGIAQAEHTRAQIRVQPSATSMVFAVSDFDGRLLGVYRMPDATVFSIDVAVAKARNTVYYASAALQSQDQVSGIPLGTAFTNRTFRYLAAPKYPSGSSTAPPAPFSILNTPGVNPKTGLNTGAPLPASAYNSTVLGFDSFNPGRNFSCPFTVMPQANQNGVVFFPGSTAVYAAGKLAGGFGVSGDGVDQDDVVTFSGIAGYAAPQPQRANEYFVRNIRLPYIQFSRNAQAGL